MKRISIREANQQFSKCIAAVEAGETFEVTRRGKVVAKLAPAGKARAKRRKDAGYEELRELLDSAVDNGLRRWTRDEIYDR